MTYLNCGKELARAYYDVKNVFLLFLARADIAFVARAHMHSLAKIVMRESEFKTLKRI
jgi:hypothetical protein